MAIIGLSIPVIADYKAEGNTVTYTDPVVASKAVEYSISITASENNALWGDNGIAENDKGTFQSGELSLSTTDLEQTISQRILGTKIIKKTYGDGKTADVQVFDDEQTAPYLGYGIIEMHRINGVDRFKAIWLNKVFFNIPENAATTKGETIDWQVPEITGTINRSDAITKVGEDTIVHPWEEDAWFDSEIEALEFLMFCGGKTE